MELFRGVFIVSVMQIIFFASFNIFQVRLTMKLLKLNGFGCIKFSRLVLPWFLCSCFIIAY